MSQRNFKEKVYPKKLYISERKQLTNKLKKNKINIFLPVINLMIYLCNIINDQYTYLRDLG